jgi:hypothetical protein
VFQDPPAKSKFQVEVLGLFGDWPRYEALAESSFREYIERLNWGVASRRLAELLAHDFKLPGHA